MCRIAGIIAAGSPLKAICKKVSLMCDALRSGGPDDEGIFTDETTGLVFGHRRLSIIDLSRKGHQPMADTDQKIWITFNGEIYNYLEIKEELLKAGAKFHSNTDTEVIINAWLQWGTAAFAKLRGMFAFALFDTVESATYLVRDITGVKPIYYHVQGEQLSFASEIKAFKIAGVATQPDENWQVRFLAFGHIPEPYTTLKNVRSLEKGHFLRWDHHTATHTTSSFTEKPAGPLITNIAEARDVLNKALRVSINRQLIADAPIGVFLSGGLDSSLITLMANEHKKQQLKTISIYFNEKNYDERAFQSVVLDEIEGDKFAHLVQQKDFEEFFPHIISDMDMPTTDGINTWFISKYAHEDGLKAVLSGVGADELFGGYPSFNRIKYLQYLRKLPNALLTAANYFNADRYRKVSFLATDHPYADYLLLRGLFVPSDIGKILGLTLHEVNEVLFSEEMHSPDTYDEEHAAWFETNLYMQNQLLRDTDVMSMSHGLEVRVPFLDEDLQRAAASIAPEIKFSKGQPKKILIDSFKDILPEKIWNRPKMGFTFPLQEWMGQHKDISNEDFFKGDIAKMAVRKFKNGHLHWSKVFALYQIQLHD